DQIGAVVVDRGLIQRDDSGVAEPGRRPRFALEAPADHPLARQGLDGDVAFEPLVTGHPDDAEATRPEPPVKAVAAEYDLAARTLATIPDRRGSARHPGAFPRCKPLPLFAFRPS